MQIFHNKKFKLIDYTMIELLCFFLICTSTGIAGLFFTINRNDIHGIIIAIFMIGFGIASLVIFIIRLRTLEKKTIQNAFIKAVKRNEIKPKLVELGLKEENIDCQIVDSNLIEIGYYVKAGAYYSVMVLAKEYSFGMGLIEDFYKDTQDHHDSVNKLSGVINDYTSNAHLITEDNHIQVIVDEINI